MKITKSQIKKIIQEELQKILSEVSDVNSSLEEEVEALKGCIELMDNEDAVLAGKLIELILKEEYGESLSISTQLVTNAPYQCREPLQVLVQKLQGIMAEPQEEDDILGLMDLMEAPPNENITR